MLCAARPLACACALLVVSCGGEPSPPDAGADAAVAVDGPEDQRPAERPVDVARPLDAAPDVATDGRVDVGADARGDVAAAACPASPNPDETGITAYQTDLLARLTGDEEVAPGITLPDRATALNRMRARDYLSGALRSLGLEPQLHSYGSGANVYARLASTTGGAEHLVLGAHFDTVGLSPGADDNASGVVAVLAVARQLAQLGCRSRPVIFVLFDEEERGILGSKEFARKLIDDKVPVHSVHTVDQVGWDRNGDRLVELELPDAGLRPLYEAAVRALGVTIPLVSTTTRSSDHSSFRPTFPAIGVTEGYVSRDTSPHMHRLTDRLANIELAYLRSTTVLVMRVFADLLR